MARKIILSTLLYRCFKHSGKYKELSCSRRYGSFWDYTKRPKTWRQSKSTGELWQDPQDAQNNLLPSTLEKLCTSLPKRNSDILKVNLHFIFFHLQTTNMPTLNVHPSCCLLRIFFSFFDPNSGLNVTLEKPPSKS